jgi:putative competence protein comGC
MKKEKNGGFTLVEVLVYISIITILFTIVFNILQNQKQKQEFTIQKRNISQFIRKIQQYAQYNKKEYILDFRISENIAYFVDKENGKGDIIGKLEISRNISYMTNNNDKNADFKRKTTNEGNFEKGFSIYLLDKKGKKIYYRISTNTINAAKYPIISIYRAKTPIDIDSDYTKSNLWEEEL